MGQLNLNWGCYCVHVEYSSPTTYRVTYHGGNYDGTPYRKLTAPERDAVEAAIREKEGEKMGLVRVTNDGRMRDHLAFEFIKIRFNNLSQPIGPRKTGNVKIHSSDMKLWAEEAYELADAMLAARTKTATCVSCGKDKTESCG